MCNKVILIKSILDKLDKVKDTSTLKNVDKAIDSCLLVEQLREQHKN